MTRNFVFKRKKSTVFFNIAVASHYIYTHEGKSGPNGKWESRFFADREKRDKEIEKIILQKIKKGYEPDDTAAVATEYTEEPYVDAWRSLCKQNSKDSIEYFETIVRDHRNNALNYLLDQVKKIFHELERHKRVPTELFQQLEKCGSVFLNNFPAYLLRDIPSAGIELKFLQLNKELAMAYVRAGKTLFEAEKFKEAMNWFSSAKVPLSYFWAQEINKWNWFPDSTDAGNQLYSGLACYLNEQYTSAVHALEEYNLSHSGYTGSFILACAYHQKEDLGKALLWYTKAAEFDCKNPTTYFDLAFVIAKHQKDYTKATEVVNKAISLNSEIPDFYFYLACFHSMNNKPDEAMNALETALIKGYDKYYAVIENPWLKNVLYLEPVKKLVKKYFAIDLVKKATITIHAEAYGKYKWIKPPYELWPSKHTSTSKFTVEQTQEKFGVKNLDESACKTILELMNWQLQNLKHAFAGPHERRNKIDTLVISFIINLKDESKKIKVNEAAFFTQAAKFESLHSSILIYVQSTTDDYPNRPEHFWRDDEIVAGTDAILALVYADKKYIPDYVSFLRNNDLDHEVNQWGDINKVISHHEWNVETVYLAVARLLSCVGQHGDEQFKELFENGIPGKLVPLREYISIPENFEMFYHAVLRDLRENSQGTEEEFYKEIDELTKRLEPFFRKEDFERLKNDFL